MNSWTSLHYDKLIFLFFLLDNCFLFFSFCLLSATKVGLPLRINITWHGIGVIRNIFFFTTAAFPWALLSLMNLGVFFLGTICPLAWFKTGPICVYPYRLKHNMIALPTAHTSGSTKWLHAPPRSTSSAATSSFHKRASWRESRAASRGARATKTTTTAHHRWKLFRKRASWRETVKSSWTKSKATVRTRERPAHHEVSSIMGWLRSWTKLSPSISADSGHLFAADYHYDVLRLFKRSSLKQNSWYLHSYVEFSGIIRQKIALWLLSYLKAQALHDPAVSKFRHITSKTQNT